jgi:hypothetical protein
MTSSIDESAIRLLAYKLWEERGRPGGLADEHWREAERQLASAAVDESGRESFPASDSPASRLPDCPPANAADKWAADAAEARPLPVAEPVREDNPVLERANANASGRNRPGRS